MNEVVILPERTFCVADSVACLEQASQSTPTIIKNENHDEGQDLYEMILDEVPFTGPTDKVKRETVHLDEDIS